VLIKPVPPPYDPLEWARKPFVEKSQMVCRAWAMQGYGTPIAVYLAYVVKIALYIAGWMLACGQSPGMGGLHDISRWWMEPVAYQKAILWSMLFELLGLGCGSGPLTGRYVPPIGGALYFLRPGTTKLPLVKALGHRRGLLDVGLYALEIGLLGYALSSPTPPGSVLAAIAVVTVALGVLDKTLFLAARGEHYWTTVAVFALTSSWIPGAKAMHAALWFWAGVSKLNHHFPSVVGVMTSNSPFTRFELVRRLMYRSYPHDLRPSTLATLAGHAGTLLELAVPLVLLVGRGDTVTLVGLGLMLMLHCFITSNVPMGVPLEWNVVMVYGGFFLFWKNAGIGIGEMTLPVLVLVGFMGFVVPLLGNLFPSKIPFLLAMRYYAGNWAYSVWFFRGKAHEKLDRLTKSSGWVHDQLGVLYDRATAVGLVGKVIAFRLMHLHGRLLGELLPRALPRFEDYEWMDGEIVAGLVLGWNFGDGHLHREDLLEAVQDQCAFDDGELRVIMVEAQPVGRSTLHWRIHDAKAGLLEEGHANVHELRKRQPWDVALT
jgi:hypothetical protein